MQNLELKLDMLEQERDVLQQELQSASDTIYQQRLYIRNCKQLIRNLRPGEALDDNGDLQPIDLNVAELPVRGSHETLGDVQQRQADLIDQQQQVDIALREAQKQFENVMKAAKDAQMSVVTEEPVIQQVLGECRYYIRELRAQLSRPQKESTFYLEKVQYEKSFQTQRDTISALQQKQTQLQADNALLRQQLTERTRGLDALSNQLQLIRQQSELYNTDLTTVSRNLNSYERSLFDTQMSSGLAAPQLSQQLLRMKADLALSDTANQQNERQLLLVYKQFAAERQRSERLFVDLRTDFASLYSKVQTAVQSYSLFVEQSDTKLLNLQLLVEKTAKVLSGFDSDSAEANTYEKENVTLIRQLLSSLDEQITSFANKPLVTRQAEQIEQIIKSYQDIQKQLLTKLEDSEKQLIRIRAETLATQRETKEVKRETDAAVVELKASFEALRQAAQ